MAGGFNLSDFMSHTKDFSRGYLFYIKVPPRAGGVGAVEGRYLVRAASLPTSTIEQATTSWQGNAYKLGTTQTFEDWTVTYNVDQSDNIRHTYLNWMELVHNAASNKHGHTGPNGTDGYMTNITVEHLSHRDGKVITKYELIGAWPTSVGAMTLAYDAKDIAQFDVTFAYQFHKTGPIIVPDGGEDQTLPGSTNIVAS